MLSRVRSGKEFIVEQVDVDQALAWKLGYFMFEDEPLSGILKQLSRWYNIEAVNYESPELATKVFSGTISKYSNAAQVLQKLELTGAVHFKIDGRKVVVMR